MNGDGSPLRSYLYAADLAIWLWTILFEGQPCRLYNVGSASSINIADLARLVCQLIDPGIEVTIAHQADPLQPPQRYVPSIDRARSELMLESWITLEDSMERTIGWHRRANSG